MTKPKEQDVYRAIIDKYDSVIGSIRGEAESGRGSFGGTLRRGKGALVEDIGKLMVKAAWIKGGRSLEDYGQISFSTTKHKIPINTNYLLSLPSEDTRRYLEGASYSIRQDISVLHNKNFVLSIECKAYTENAMFKRILVDAALLRSRFPNLRFALIQLESQLTGDYSRLTSAEKGSHPTHTLQSYFPDVRVEIITLLKGERKVDQPIDDPAYRKPLTIDALKRGVQRLSDVLHDAISCPQD